MEICRTDSTQSVAGGIGWTAAMHAERRPQAVATEGRGAGVVAEAPGDPTGVAESNHTLNPKEIRMVQRYVWFDDVDRLEVVRTELRLPKPLHDFIRQVADQQDVSMNVAVTGMLAYIADGNAHRRLVIEKVPGVRVTDSKTAGKPATVPLLDVTPRGHVVYKTPKVP